MADPIPAVYTKIAAVSAELAQVGISKGRKNAQQGYSFRGIDDVLNELAPRLANHGLVILPRVLSREHSERESRSGGTLFSVTVHAAFDFVAAVDGSVHTVQTYGEAMDSADKATNKAMSAAYKYAAFLAFCIPTEGENDADGTTHEVAARPAAVSRPVTPVEPPTGDSHANSEADNKLRVTGVRKAKSGSNAKGPWNLWIVAFSDNRELKTFDDDVAATCARLRNRPVYVAADGDKLTNVHEAA